MPKQQRMMRIEQRGTLAAIQELEGRSDEELERIRSQAASSGSSALKVWP